MQVTPDAVTCVLGDIPAGEHRTVNVTLLPALIGHTPSMQACRRTTTRGPITTASNSPSMLR